MKRKALLIFAIAIVARLLFISLDPYLHEWDERFHALVAKNMIEEPLKPMLYKETPMDFSYKDWTRNHIWLHKQPLFLWQMAASMKVFGASLFSMRLPSAILGAFTAMFTFLICFQITRNQKIAFIAGLLYALAFFPLELVSGRIGMDHNDIAFTFYVTLSIWAFLKYRQSLQLHWLVFIGLACGLAILNKWLTGLLVYSAWGVLILTKKEERKSLKSYLHVMISLAITCLVFIPWQIYISNEFPLESAWEYEYNRRHIFEVIEEHSGSLFYHLNELKILYGQIFIPILIIGLVQFVRLKPINKEGRLVTLILIIVPYLFFTFAATKVKTHVFMVSPLIYCIISIGVFALIEFLTKVLKVNTVRKRDAIFGLVIVVVCIVNLRPKNIFNYRSESNQARNAKIHNTQIFNSLNKELTDNYLIYNCKSFEGVELMFFNDNSIAYHWYPTKEEFDELLKKGHKLAFFKSHGNQYLPNYITGNKQVRIIDKELK